jgi:UDP-N-acetylmuramoyl-L-alanyl-D-glutamate--2,6-diaminopimelate ligase
VRAWDACSWGHALRARRDLQMRGVGATLGGDARSVLEAHPRPACIVKSPGVPFDAPIIRLAAERGLAIIDELELGWRLMRSSMVGVTGTNGKSTTAALVRAVMQAAGIDAPVTGNTRFGPPLSGVALHESWVVCEASSYQLQGCPALLPEAAVFTNLTRDHLHYHGTMRQYAACKRRMFVRDVATTPLAAVNVGDGFGRHLADDVEARGGRVVRYGLGQEANYRLERCDWTLRSGRLSIATPVGQVTLETRLPGPHNALNVTAALALADGLGLDADAAQSAVERMPGLPGRFEALDEGQSFDVVVDYAHTPDGTRHALITARRIVAARAGARLRVVAGIVGGHDPPEQRGMGRIARLLADHLVLTASNQRGERPLPMVQDMLRGARNGWGGRLEVVLDRRLAIERALRAAKPGDLVAILGRGSLPGQLIDRSGTWYEFDDRSVARELLDAC